LRKTCACRRKKKKNYGKKAIEHFDTSHFCTKMQDMCHKTNLIFINGTILECLEAR